MPPRPTGLSLALISITIVAGLAIRFAHLGLPPFLVKYGGSALWALTIYWLLSTLLPSKRLSIVTVLAGTLATSVEFLKLLHHPALDAFRMTLPGILLLGRFFSWWDIMAYWLAILAGALIDLQIRSRIS
jgi:hypothetical protein